MGERLGTEVNQRARTLAKDTSRLNRNPAFPDAEKMALMQRRFDAAFRPTLLELLELAETDIGVGENGSLGKAAARTEAWMRSLNGGGVLGVGPTLHEACC